MCRMLSNCYGKWINTQLLVFATLKRLLEYITQTRNNLSFVFTPPTQMHNRYLIHASDMPWVTILEGFESLRVDVLWLFDARRSRSAAFIGSRHSLSRDGRERATSLFTKCDTVLTQSLNYWQMCGCDVEPPVTSRDGRCLDA